MAISIYYHPRKRAFWCRLRGYSHTFYAFKGLVFNVQTTIKALKERHNIARYVSAGYQYGIFKRHWNPVIGLPLATARYLAGKKPAGEEHKVRRGVV